MIAVVVDETLAVAEEVALPLHPLVEIVRVDRISARKARVDDLDTGAVEVDPRIAGIFLDHVVATDENRCAELLVRVCHGGAHHLLFLTLGEDDALRLATHPIINALQGRGDRIATGRQFLLVLLDVEDRPTRNARVHCRLGNSNGNRRDKAWIERDRDDVVRAELGAVAAIGRGHIVRHILAGKISQCLRGGDLHRVVDCGGAYIKRATEDVGETEDVVDLVRIVGTAGCHDRVRTDLGHFLRCDFRIGIGHREDDRVLRHGQDHRLGEGALSGKTEHDVGAFHGVGKRALVRLDGVGGLPLVHAFGAALVDHALGIAEDDVLRGKSHCLDQFDAGDAGRPCTVADELGVLHVAAGDLQRVDEARGRDDRGAVLVIMEDRDIHHLAQTLLDDEAVRRLDVFKVDAAERRAKEADAIDELVDVLRVDFQVYRIDISKALEQHRLAFHHRLRGQRAQIAEAKDGGAVGNDSNHVAARGIVEGARRILGDRLHGNGDTRRIGERQVPLRCHRLGRDYLELARPAHRMKIERLLRADGRSALAGLVIQRHGLSSSFPGGSFLWSFREMNRLRLHLPAVNRQSENSCTQRAFPP